MSLNSTFFTVIAYLNKSLDWYTLSSSEDFVVENCRKLSQKSLKKLNFTLPRCGDEWINDVWSKRDIENKKSHHALRWKWNI